MTAGRRASRPLHTLRIPGGLISKPLGLGTAVERASNAVGLSPCGGCRARAQRLDAWVELAPRDRARRA